MRLILFVLTTFSTLGLGQDAGNGRIGIQRKLWQAGNRYLVVEILDDDIAHFELSEVKPDQDPMKGIWTSPMIDKAAMERFRGPSGEGFRVGEGFIETKVLRLEIENDSSCIRAIDRLREVQLTRLCGDNLAGKLAGPKEGRVLKIERSGIENLYGVGNLFQGSKNGGLPSADGDWIGRHWEARNHGNFRFGPHRPKDLNQAPQDDSFYGGGPSVSQFPILYGLGRAARNGFQTFGLLLDTIYRTSWYFDQNPDLWLADTWGDQLRFFVIAGRDLSAVRKRYLEITGRPPVPPRSSFGLWISKFGYKQWAEIERDLNDLRAAGFPTDGVALDLQWFGGSFGEPSSGRMGSLSFGDGFPNAEAKLSELTRKYGVSFMPIEESYVDYRIPDFGLMEGRRYLAMLERDGGRAVNLTRDIKTEGGGNNDVWWGRGGMVDWSNPDARSYWHQSRRHPLSKMGIFNHWLDLGEPEMYYEWAWYRGIDGLNDRSHGGIHNLYNLLWAKGIADGYADPNNRRELQDKFSLEAAPRFFTMSRAGTIGSQRYGAMWSGDVGRNRSNYVAHENTQMHLSMAGMDFYGSDAGGFLGGEDGSLPGSDDDELFTQWFSNNSLSSIPLRPHRWSLDEDLSTPKPFGPHNRGVVESNLANTRQRYSLSPYYYSLAHLAHWEGEPILPPLVYYFPGDRKVREMGNQKMIGPSLMFGIVLGYGQTARALHFPEGDWVNVHSGEWVSAANRLGAEFPVYREREGRGGIFTTPLFGRAGGIVPRLKVEERTRNLRELTDELSVTVFQGPQRTSFSLFEDDGVSVAYESGRFRKTRVTQESVPDGLAIEIAKAEGNGYRNAPSDRNFEVEAYLKNREAASVEVNGRALAYCRRAGDWNCWYSGNDVNFMTPEERALGDMLGNGYLPRRGRAYARTERLSVDQTIRILFKLGKELSPSVSAHFTCSNGETQPGESIYVIGNSEVLGKWNPEKAVRLLPVRYPKWRRWSGMVYGLPSDSRIEWKCIKRRETGKDVLAWDGQDNHVIQTPTSGFAGTYYADF